MPTPTNEPAFAPRPPWIQGQIIFYEQNHGPLPDVVETDGQHLVAQPHTPVFPPTRSETDAFATLLDAKLDALTSHQRRRCLGYGREAAEEWPIDRTPPKIRRAQKERLRATLRASLEEDSESDIEATLNTYYPLSPTPPESKDSPSLAPPPPTIESNSATKPPGPEAHPETSVDRRKRKHAQTDETIGHEEKPEHRKRRRKSDHDRMDNDSEGPGTSDMKEQELPTERGDDSDPQLGIATYLPAIDERHAAVTNLTSDTGRNADLGAKEPLQANCTAVEDTVGANIGRQNDADPSQDTRPRPLTAEEPQKRPSSWKKSQRGTKKRSSPKAKKRKAKQATKLHEHGRGERYEEEPLIPNGQQVENAPLVLESKTTELLEANDISPKRQEQDRVTAQTRRRRKQASLSNGQGLRRSERLRRKQGITRPPG